MLSVEIFHLKMEKEKKCERYLMVMLLCRGVVSLERDDTWWSSTCPGTGVGAAACSADGVWLGAISD